MRKFTPEEVSALIQDNVWEDISSVLGTKQRSLNNIDDGDITATVNALVSTIENLQDTVCQITDDQTDNVGGNNNGGNNNGAGKNNVGCNKNGGSNAQNGNVCVNNRSNSGNLSGSARRGVAFSCITTARVATKSCMICIMFQILQNLILWHVHNQTIIRILSVLKIT